MKSKYFRKSCRAVSRTCGLYDANFLKVVWQLGYGNHVNSYIYQYYSGRLSIGLHFKWDHKLTLAVSKAAEFIKIHSTYKKRKQIMLVIYYDHNVSLNIIVF